MKSVMKKVASTAAVLLLVLAATPLFAGGEAEESASAPEEKVVTTVLQEKIDTFDVFVSALAEPLKVLGMVCETLVVYDENLQVQPLLAESWSVSEDQLTWSFKLKEGVNFHDGTPLNAENLTAYMWDHMFEKSFNAWEFEVIDEMVVTGEYTFDFHLSEPYPMLINYLADPWNIIESAGTREELGDRYGFEGLVGTGPFMFEEWVRGDHVTLVRNPDYKHGPAYLSNRGPAHVDKIIFRIIPEPITRVTELQYGNVDYLQKIPANMIEKVQEDENITVEFAPASRVVFLECNMEQPIMQNKEIRKALNYAANRDALIKATYSGYGEKAYSILDPGATGYWKKAEEYGKDKLRYDPEMAREVLDNAGWTLHEGKEIREKDGEPLVLNLIAMNVPRYQLPAEAMVDLLQQVGIGVELEIFDAAATNERLVSGDFDIVVSGWAYNMGEVTLDLIVGAQSIPNPNYSRYNSPEIEKQLKIVRLGRTAEERNKASAAIQQQIVDDMIVIPLFNAINSIGYKNNLTGVENVLSHPWWPDLAFALELDVK